MNITQLRKKAKFNKKVAFNHNFSRYSDGDADLLAFKAENNKIAEDLRKTKGYELNITKILSDLFADDVPILETITIGSNIQAQQSNSNFAHLSVTGRNCLCTARQYYDSYGIIPCDACDGLAFDSQELFACLAGELCTSEGPFKGGFPVNNCVANSLQGLESCAGDCDPCTNQPINGSFDVAIVGDGGRPSAFVFVVPAGPYGLVQYWHPNGRGPNSRNELKMPELFSNVFGYAPTCVFTKPKKINIVSSIGYTSYWLPDTSSGLGTVSSPYKYSVDGSDVRSPRPAISRSLRTVFPTATFPKALYAVGDTYIGSVLKVVSYTVPTTFTIRFITSDAYKSHRWKGGLIRLYGDSSEPETIYEVDKANRYIPAIVELNINSNGARNWVAGLGNTAKGTGVSYLLAEDSQEKDDMP